MERMERWQYYTSSYVRIEPTEGVPRRKMLKSVLTRNMPTTADAESEDNSAQPKPLVYSEELTLRICVNSAKIMYKEPGQEFFIYTDKPMTTDANGISTARERLQKFEDARKERFKEKFEMNNRWMKGLNHDQVSKVTMDFKKWMDEGIVPGTETAVVGAPGDSEMAQ
jgi:paired amphipathic helix protein Sin3a